MSLHTSAGPSKQARRGPHLFQARVAGHQVLLLKAACGAAVAPLLLLLSRLLPSLSIAIAPLLPLLLGVLLPLIIMAPATPLLPCGCC